MSTLTIPQGTDYAVTWPISPPPQPGATARSQVRETVDSPTVLHEWSSELGNVTIDEAGVTLHVPPVVSSAWTWRRGVFDVEYVDADGVTSRIDSGRVKVSPEVTR